MSSPEKPETLTSDQPDSIESMEKKYSGQLGIVLSPDNSLAEKAKEAEARFHSGNAIKLGLEHAPHITLYHSKLDDVPLVVADEILESIAAKLPLAVNFVRIAPFGGKFLFWDTKKSPELIALHQEALRLAQYFQKEGEQQADREGISLSAEEAENVKAFGNPLVRGLWRPHVTLGYYPDGAPQNTEVNEATGNIVHAAFIRVGQAGTVAEIIAQR